ncbi:MAG: Uma2 family endonuclease [Microcoleaceae cyanobacterium]
MSEKLTLLPHEYPDTTNMILEDDTPLDSFIDEKQQRILTTVFYSSAEIPINAPFIVGANLGLFSHVGDSGIVPDVFLSLNIPGGEQWWERNVRSYLFWEFGKSPDIVIEIVSPTPGNELGSKLTSYAQLSKICGLNPPPFKRIINKNFNNYRTYAKPTELMSLRR